MLVWTLLAALGLPGCFYIGNDLHERELDGDADGVSWPDDCDPDDPLASERREWFADADGDGFGDPAVSLDACGLPVGFVANSDDCDDNDFRVNPQGTERCDGLGADEDCDGLVDDADEAPEGRFTFFTDSDGDGYGNGALAVQACVQPEGAVPVEGDCNDDDPDVRPGGVEVCGGEDEDCDGVEDDQDASVTGTQAFWIDGDSDGFGDPAQRVFRCVATSGLVSDDTDCDDSRAGVNPAASEICDPGQIDENCNGQQNEDGDTIPYYVDADGDGYGDVTLTVQACAQPLGYVPDATDCNDAHAGRNPGATEICDPADVDENCNGLSDDAEAGPLIGPGYSPDVDGDGFGDASVAAVVYCDTVPSGLVADSTDCDDAEALVRPTAPEVCDGIDNDCDGQIDDADANVSGRTEWYRDADGDGFGAGIASFVLACTAPSSEYVADATDCDDADSAVNPSASEVCGGGDEDCDGGANDADPEGASGTSTFYIDNDGDGFGSASIQACQAPLGAVGDGTDCDDTDILVHPGGVERCGGGDEDCDGSTDEADAADANVLYADTDGDGYGDPSAPLSTCAATAPQHVTNAGDCNDGSSAISPAANESCAPGDEDCDGLEGDSDSNPTGTSTFYLDADGDGFGGAVSVQACAAPPGFRPTSTDCNDGNSAVSPSGTEVCDPNDLDEDCNGVADDAAAQQSSKLPYYEDRDGDGWGSSVLVDFACEPPAGFAATNSDCDDFDTTSNPEILEFCDPSNADNDCDGFPDDSDPEGASGQLLFFADADGDGYGDENDPGTLLCDPLSGEELDNTDCADGDADRNPGEREYAQDGIDSNCDGADDLCGGGFLLVPTTAFPTIQSAVDASCPGDEVEVTAGTYAENLDLTGRDIILDSVSSANRAVIDGQNLGPVLITDGSTDVDDLILRNGSGTNGGCAQVVNGVDVDFTQVAFENCNATGNGGALHVDINSELDCDECTVDGASAGGDGGAFYGAGRLFLFDGSVTNATAGGDGGAYAMGNAGNGLVSGMLFQANSATNGGAIACLGCSHLDFYSSDFVGNSATAHGGAVYVLNASGSHGDVDDNDFVSNTAGGDGGGMYYGNTTNWNSDFDNDFFDGNVAVGRGGGLFLSSVYGTDLDDQTFTNNTAADGAAIYATDVLMDWDRTVASNNAHGTGSTITVLNSTTDFRAIDQMVLTDNDGTGPALYVEGTSPMDLVGFTLDNPGAGGNAVFVGRLDVLNLLASGTTLGPSVRMESSATNDATLTNATIADNTGQPGLEVEFIGTSSLTVNNAILTGNGTGLDNTAAGNVPAVTYTDVFGNTTAYAGMANPGGTNLSVNPLFVGGGDYHLGPGSPLIDAGDPGLSDPDTSRSDLGAYGGPLAQ